MGRSAMIKGSSNLWDKIIACGSKGWALADAAALEKLPCDSG